MQCISQFKKRVFLNNPRGRRWTSRSRTSGELGTWPDCWNRDKSSITLAKLKMRIDCLPLLTAFVWTNHSLQLHQTPSLMPLLTVLCWQHTQSQLPIFEVQQGTWQPVMESLKIIICTSSVYANKPYIYRMRSTTIRDKNTWEYIIRTTYYSSAWRRRRS